MKTDIHPTWYAEAQIRCLACGTVWVTGSTVESLTVDICSNCHPFYTGEQKIVDTEGRVDAFMKRLRVRDQREAEQQAKVRARNNAELPLEDLGLGTRYEKILKEAGINLISDLIVRLEDGGDDAILELPGIGFKVLADAKRRISERGFKVYRDDEE